MEGATQTMVYADESTSYAYWLEDGTRVLRSPMTGGTFSADGSEPPFGKGMANDLAAHVKRIQAALHRVAGRPDLAEAAEREAKFYDVCADHAEAACVPGGHREFRGGAPAVEDGRVVAVTLGLGDNTVPALA